MSDCLKYMLVGFVAYWLLLAPARGRGGLGQASAAEAWVPWVVSVWEAYRGETPPMDVVYPLAHALASGRVGADEVIARLSG